MPLNNETYTGYKINPEVFTYEASVGFWEYNDNSEDNTEIRSGNGKRGILLYKNQREKVKALLTSGLVNGKSGKIAPTDNTTHVEEAVLIKRILDYTNK